MRKNKRKQYTHNIKRKNLSTVNFADLPEATRQQMCDQILKADATNGTRVTSLVTTPSTRGYVPFVPSIYFVSPENIFHFQTA